MNNRVVLTLLITACGLALSPVEAEDSVEFLNGTKMQGSILQIRGSAKEFDFRSRFGGQTLTRTYPYSKVHAVTFKGKRYVLTPKPAGGDPAARTDLNRTEAEVLELIETVGKSRPEWFDSTRTNHPKSLDLSWPLKTPGPWNESKNVGQYIWGRVNPNESRWKPGIKLIYECMDRHQGDPDLLVRDMSKLGEMYFELLQDYPRAAFWLQKAKAPVTKRAGIHLAECYWRLGNREMALNMMRGETLNLDAIKLLGDMGEIEGALQVAEVYGRTNAFNQAFLSAGDALRGAGRLDEAVEYYQRVLDRNSARNEDYKKRFLARAAGAIEAIRLFDQADVQRVADGTYTDSSTGYNGKLTVQLTVRNKRIDSVEVTKHSEKQYYAALSDTTKQIVDQQGIREVDGTSGATITSQAIIHATAKALAQGAKPL